LIINDVSKIYAGLNLSSKQFIFMLEIVRQKHKTYLPDSNIQKPSVITTLMKKNSSLLYMGYFFVIFPDDCVRP